jgi:hypothetical protein
VLDRTTKDAGDQEDDAVMQGKIVEIVFRNAHTTIERTYLEENCFSWHWRLFVYVVVDDSEFLCSFVHVLYEFSQFPFVEALVDHVYQV